MPATFSGFGIGFLYPENWTQSDPTEQDADAAPGVTFETPEGAFVSVNRYAGVTNPQQVIDEAVAAMRGEYDPLEVEPCAALSKMPELAGLANTMIEAGADLSFYVLDLLITARLIAIVESGDVIFVQMQGESRDFDKLEAVFAAVMKTLRDSLQQGGDA